TWRRLIERCPPCPRRGRSMVAVALGRRAGVDRGDHYVSHVGNLVEPYRLNSFTTNASITALSIISSWSILATANRMYAQDSFLTTTTFVASVRRFQWRQCSIFCGSKALIIDSVNNA